MTDKPSARIDLPEWRTIAVWDLPTRLFKWSLVGFVSLAFLVSSSHPYGSLFFVHVACGYAVTLLLLFRLAWGFIGGEHARFRPKAVGRKDIATKEKFLALSGLQLV